MNLDKISVCLPVYKCLDFIESTLKPVLEQDFTNYEIIIGNDWPQDNVKLKELISKINDPRIRVISNKENLGYPGNIRQIVKHAQNEILFFLCQDDTVLDRSLFRKIIKVFNDDPSIGVITRPYYWYSDHPNSPNRHIPKCPQRVITLNDDPEVLRQMMNTVGQLSGLVFRKSLVRHNFHDHVFPSHAYPFYSIMRTHKCYYWPDYMIAVWTKVSQTKHKPRIYSPAPTWTWVIMFNTVLPEPEFEKARSTGIKLFTENHLGLVQIRNYGRIRDYFKDAYYLLKYNKFNLISAKFWFVFLGGLIVPRLFLIKMVDAYHNRISKIRFRRILET